VDSPALTRSDRRSFKLLIWAALPVLTLAAFVQITGVGIDILVVAAAALLLLGLERSVGDWLGEWFGPVAAALIFVAAAVALSWYFLADSLGRSQTEHFFVEAERRGYSPVYYQIDRSSTADSGGTADAPAASTPVAASDAAAGGAAAVPVERRDPAPERQDQADPPEESAAPRAVSTAGSDRDGRDAPARSSILSFLRRNSSPAELIATEIAVSLSPPEIKAARRTVIRAAVRGSGAPVTAGTVEFTVNGLGAGRITVNADGVASTTFQTHMPGTYEVRARFSGTSRFASSRSGPVLLQVGYSR